MTDEDLLGSDSFKASAGTCVHLAQRTPLPTCHAQELKDYFRAMFKAPTEEDLNAFFVG